jgi:hypothetical protein
MVLLIPPNAPVAPARAPLASLAKSPAAAVKPFSPVPIPPLNWLTVVSKFDFNESKPSLAPAITLDAALEAASDAALTCSETPATKSAKGFTDLDILVIFPYYTLFILDKMCYYINYWRILKQ